MRLFYIIIFLITSLNFTGYGSQDAKKHTLINHTKALFISAKKQIKSHADFNKTNERLQKDLVSSSVVKIFSCVLFLLLIPYFLFLKNKFVNSATVVKQLRFNYWCLFKMLYPKHVFW
ncbi:hypothetical protein [Pedobacter endophyticus]|uniref:Uncharacterized protein n=1 Tax=Pedobacter endophyticus TaxID=2789740 RepID=A0A7S9L2K7_9SPHI|nr:hypothetical protein [Pedobacter endophyticus]QPH41324.1 hypothetical protein IZT61_08750 [Pedobacter endophyticus]